MSGTVYGLKKKYTVPQLRGLVRIAQSRINEISAAMESMGIDELKLTPAWLVKCEQAEAQLKHYQRLLGATELAESSTTFPPAAPAHPEALAGSLVTNDAAQPADSSST